MSLLMDALKKAEQEKKEAAKRLKEAQEKSGGQIKLQEDIPTKPSTAEEEQTIVKEGDDSEEANPPVITEKKPSPELSLSPLDETAADPAVNQEPVTEKTGENETASSLSLNKDITIDHPEIPDTDDDSDFDDEIVLTSDTDKTFGLDSLSVENATSKPFDDTENVALQGKHDDTMSDSRISRSVVSAADLVKDMGGGKEVPTPVAAQTVFRASARSSGKQQFLEWSLFIGLLAIILVAAGSFYYLKITPLTPETSSPLVAKGVEREQIPDINIPAVENAEKSDHSSEITPGENISESTGELTGNLPGIEPAEMKPDVAEQSPVGESEQASNEVDTEETEDIESNAVANTEIYPDKQLVQETLLPEKIQVDEKAIAISRSKSVDKNDQLVNTAYLNYEQGNYPLAESLYHDVLKQNPENRDAMLGIAAIAYRKGDIQSAYKNYLAILKLFPKDTAAKTALVSLQNNANPAESESILKLMIRENPETPYLYFTLGNIYAKQLRWADAQQAFFDAYRLQSDNSDYAYNLAVSLDHIGQTGASKKYYSIALDLADKSPASFNTASVIARLSTLSTVSGSE